MLQPNREIVPQLLDGDLGAFHGLSGGVAHQN